jgi:hypothetical protein
MKTSVLKREGLNQKLNHSRFSDSMGILRAAEKCNGSEIAETALSWWEVCVQVIERR